MSFHVDTYRQRIVQHMKDRFQLTEKSKTGFIKQFRCLKINAFLGEFANTAMQVNYQTPVNNLYRLGMMGQTSEEAHMSHVFGC